ncbi:Peptidase family M23 [uncultured Ruminococcus sp.]|jgi:murein DD-endopeptidase MepM/ murein hydrolase activator NlpD|uniref:M23 family metallopeptidase n=1 Tax=Pseudoruminococcus massiliensis TaxID=2086583 RepID=UPI000821B0A8|nr:Peptidase family M23 [uncultured Ruminococcus sp.]
MSEEYKNRGVLHKLHKVGTPSKNILIKAVTKSVLITETTALITKDAITNRFSGKEFHIHFERSQHKSGKFKTDVKIVRANAPLYKQKGIFHKLADSGRFFEGDVPFRKRQIKYSPKSKFGKVAYSATKPLISTSKFTIKAAKKVVKATALTAESAVITSSSFALNKLRQRLSYSSDTLDGGKAVLSSITAVRNLNNARKYIIRYRAERKEYSQLKQSFKAQKFKVKKAKQSFKLEKQSYKSFKQGQKKRLKTISKVYKSTNKSKARFKAIKKVYKPQKKGKLQKLNQKQRIQKNTRLKKLQRKKNLSLEKKIYKNQEKFKKLLKKQKKKAKVVPIAALPLVPVAAGTKQLTASMRQKLLMSDPNNDALQAVDKSVAVVKKTVKTAKSAKRKLQNKTEPARKSKLHKQANRLQQKKQNPPKKKKYKKKKPQQTFKQKAQEAAKKAAKKTVKIAADFTKFAFKMFGILLLPILAIIFILSVLMLMFTGTAGNSSYILGTYNAQDRYLSDSIENYTKIAYNFNQKILKCKSDWKNGLSDFGVDTSSYKTTPKHFYFGKSTEFSQSTSYDFDPDLLAAFMCAYTYNFTGDGEEESVPNWEWNNDYTEVLEKLFKTEYTFKHKYEDVSKWKQLDKYTFYGGGGPNSSYWTVYSEDFTRSQMKIRNVPSEIEQFCKDGYLHYDYNSLEVLDANDGNKKTGYYIQDQRYIIKDSSGNTNNPFYAVTTANTYVWEHGTNKDGSKKYEKRSEWYWTDNKQQIYCVVNPSDTAKWNSNLKDICLISFYKKNYWYEDCSLYYTVQKNCTFDQACRKLLAEKEKDSADKDKYKDARLSFYSVLSEPQNKKGTKTYGNHQMFNAPVGGKSLEKLSGKIYNGYGYDIQTWNSEHCSLTDCHKGVDFEAKKGAKVYAMCDGYVNWINEGEQSLSINTSQDIELWYDDKDKNNKKFPFEFIYENIKTTLKQGDTVKQGQLIGEVTDYKHCWQNKSNSKASKSYLHITVKIGYPKEFPLIGTDWSEVDLRYLIYRHENEGK